jgi:hypothetical protein
MMMETRKRSDGDVVVFMAFMFLCHFLIFGMSELEWMLLDIDWMWGKGVAKQWGVNEILAMELEERRIGR